MGIEAGDPQSNTFKAKQADLSRFINYFRQVTGSDHPDQWTRSVSQGFMKHLLRAKSERTGNKLAPTTVNRVLATMRNTAKWIHRQRPFVAGYPMDRISDVSTPEPEWRGLSDVDVTRLKAAAEQLVHVHTRADQNAVRDQAILLVMLDTACRVSELIGLNLEQYRGKHFYNVQRKGNNVTDRVFVGQGARDALDRYIAEIRGHGPGPLFQSKRGRRLASQNIADALGRIVAQANSKLAKGECIQMTIHVLRHTALRKMAEKKGIRYAQQMAGHASTKYIWRYVQPSRSEMEDAIEELFD
jgi:integrase/recombinase XerD